MKTFAQLVLLAISLLILSPAKTNAAVTLEYHQIGKRVTKSVLVRAMSRAQRHALKVIDPFSCDDDGDDDDDTPDIQVGYARPKIVHFYQEFDDETVSNYVSIRLALAREKALRKYNEVTKT